MAPRDVHRLCAALPGHLAALAAFVLVVYAGAALLKVPELAGDVARATERLGELNAIASSLGIKPWTLPWVDGGSTLDVVTIEAAARAAADAVQSSTPSPPPAPCMAANDVLRDFAAFDALNKEEVASAAQVESIESLNWSYDGALFFVFTVVTTIGYGTFVPRTATGKRLVMGVGWTGILLFNLAQGVWVDSFDAVLGQLASQLLARWAGRPRRGVGSLMGSKVGRGWAAVRAARAGHHGLSPSKEAVAWCKLLLSSGLLAGYLCLLGAYAQQQAGSRTPSARPAYCPAAHSPNHHTSPRCFASPHLYVTSPHLYHTSPRLYLTSTTPHLYLTSTTP